MTATIIDEVLFNDSNEALTYSYSEDGSIEKYSITAEDINSEDVEYYELSNSYEKVMFDLYINLGSGDYVLANTVSAKYRNAYNSTLLAIDSNGDNVNWNSEQYLKLFINTTKAYKY